MRLTSAAFFLRMFRRRIALGIGVALLFIVLELPWQGFDLVDFFYLVVGSSAWLTGLRPSLAGSDMAGFHLASSLKCFAS